MPSIQICHIPDAFSQFLVQLLLANVIYSIARDIPFANSIHSQTSVSLRKPKLCRKKPAFTSLSTGLRREDICEETRSVSADISMSLTQNCQRQSRCKWQDQALEMVCSLLVVHLSSATHNRGRPSYFQIAPKLISLHRHRLF